jgi:hypothetical protein
MYEDDETRRRKAKAALKVLIDTRDDILRRADEIENAREQAERLDRSIKSLSDELFKDDKEPLN